MMICWKLQVLDYCRPQLTMRQWAVASLMQGIKSLLLYLSVWGLLISGVTG